MLKIDRQRLHEVIKAFYIISGVKIAVYDADFKEIAAYPQSECVFCSLIQSCESAKAMCEKSTAELFVSCAGKGTGIARHKCHAGLTEVASALVDRDVVIGYVIYGQITEEQDREKFTAEVLKRCQDYGFGNRQIEGALEDIHYYSCEQLHALSLLLNMAVSYIISNRLAYMDVETLGEEVKKYLLENLAEDLKLEDICRHFYVSRSMLYKVTKADMPEGILAYIKNERMKLAKKLLETDMSLAEIAAETGYHDVAYFQRTFKKEVGISAGEFRKGKL